MCLWGVSLFSSAVFVVLALLVCAANASPTFFLGFFLSVSIAAADCRLIADDCPAAAAGGGRRVRSLSLIMT